MQADPQSGHPVLTADPEEAARRLERSREQISTKSKKDPGGDITL
jgi:hypothetical protein